MNVVIPRPRGGEDVPGLGKVCIIFSTFALASCTVFLLVGISIYLFSVCL